MNATLEREDAALQAAKSMLQTMLAPLNAEKKKALLSLLLAAVEER